MIPDQFLDELKARLRLSDVIGKYVKLKRQGREYAGLSPFTKERSPSFFVNDDKGFFHCFSSGKHGDLIAFLQETQRMTFQEAVEQLASEAGLEMPQEDPRTVEQDRKRASLADWVELAAAWFEAELRRPAGAAARAYLEQRGLPAEEWARFRLGYVSAARTGLKDYLVAKGARPAELVEAGLLIEPEEGGAPYDRFRDRIIFPITDQKGRAVSFGGRAMDPSARAKYLNGPETSIFSKGKMLYGMAAARKLLLDAQAAAPKADTPLVVVEGYMDVIACHRSEIPAVAPMGTAMTEDQMEVLWRAHPEPTLCFDGDKAGQRAAARAIDRALPLLRPGRSFRFSMIAGGQDPDDVLREKGRTALWAQVTKSAPFVDMLFAKERDAEPLKTPEQKAGLRKRLRTAANTIIDQDLAAAYREDLHARLEALFPKAQVQGKSDARTPWRARDRRPDEKAAITAAKGQVGLQVRPFHAAVAIGALTHPAWIRSFDEALERIGFGDPILQPMAVRFFDAMCEDVENDSSFLETLMRMGMADEVESLERAAALVSPPFLDPGVDPKAAKDMWSASYRLLVELVDAERAIEAMRTDEVTTYSMKTIRQLTDQVRDLKRKISSLAVWTG